MGETPPCGWCGKRSIDEVEVEPPVFAIERPPPTAANPKPKGTRVMRKRAITAHVCREHRAMVERNKAELQERREKAREARKKRRAA